MKSTLPVELFQYSRALKVDDADVGYIHRDLLEIFSANSLSSVEISGKKLGFLKNLTASVTELTLLHFSFPPPVSGCASQISGIDSLLFNCCVLLE
mmetsp:Transcript_4333/g.8349  ORF Transcript_4333/g.8349 Transcript_4333/m.8349 type:complete len:96 (-) Transcript_4333:345-632(-)